MNALAVAFIKEHEGCRLTAYQDSAGVWTIGYGQTGRDVTQGTVWTQEQADARLAQSAQQVEDAILRMAHTAGRALSEQQMAALISFAYNVGTISLQGSTLWTYVRNGLWLSATKEFIHWDHAAGIELRGLLSRRLDEATLFLKGSP